MAAHEQVPPTDRHVLGLDHLSRVGRADVAGGRDLVQFVDRQIHEEGEPAQAEGGVLVRAAPGSVRGHGQWSITELYGGPPPMR